MSAAPSAGPSAETGAIVGGRSADGWNPGRASEGLIGPLLLLAGITMIVLVGARLRARRRPAAGPGGSPGEGSGGAPGRESLERMAVDLEEVARRISAMLDTRMRALDRLIRDADERIARLRESAGLRPDESRPGGEPAAGAAGAAGEAAARRTAAEQTLAHHADICGLADQGLSVQEIAERTGYQRGEVELVLSLRKAAQSGDG